ncbi:MAG: rubrerythrin family protein [Deltaproteobacteria bacterium]|nr:rubrerythrin family protein [Deltaproteobacteria bacterium]
MAGSPRWKCSVCGYVHEGKHPPDKCPQCGADLNRFIMLEPLTPALENSLKLAFAGESKAHVRNQAFAHEADKEGYTQVARLFRAVAEAERVHASEYLGYLQGEVSDTEHNLRQAFENELKAKEEAYPPLIKQAFDVGREDVAWSLVRSRDVEESHAQLYKNALQALLTDRDINYHVCQVCGYVFEGEPPEQCPVCRSGPKDFKAMA